MRTSGSPCPPSIPVYALVRTGVLVWGHLPEGIIRIAHVLWWASPVDGRGRNLVAAGDQSTPQLGRPWRCCRRVVDAAIAWVYTATRAARLQRCRATRIIAAGDGGRLSGVKLQRGARFQSRASSPRCAFAPRSKTARTRVCVFLRRPPDSLPLSIYPWPSRFRSSSCGRESLWYTDFASPRGWRARCHAPLQRAMPVDEFRRVRSSHLDDQVLEHMTAKQLLARPARQTTSRISPSTTCGDRAASGRSDSHGRRR